MESYVLNKKGVSALEATIIAAIIGYILSMIISNGIQQIQISQFQKTVTEMKAIAQASIDYYVSQGSCPTGINQLAPTFMPQAVTSSPFNSSYQLSCSSNAVSVSDWIPTGLAQKNPEGPLLQITTSGGQDNITITQTISYAFIGRALYEKNYVYGGT